MNNICFFSSGAASWLAAKRVSQKFGKNNLYLVFADTGIEDEDNYRFLQESAQNVGGTLIWLKDGRTPWDIFKKHRFINHRQSNCSIELKIKPCENWLKSQGFEPHETILYFGIGFEEINRIDAISKNWHPFRVDIPLCWDEFGWADRQTIMAELLKEGLKRPRLYDLGFSHANCGGFCPKAGLKHYQNLLEKLPDVYAHHEKQEQEFLNYLDRSDVGILRKSGKAITLREWKEHLNSQPRQMSLFESEGGCGCFI